MQTILERSEAIVIRDRSQFIGVLVHVTSSESIKQYLESIKKEYPKAKHYCYAYILHEKKKCSDDGEPAKTAGRPLLELLKKKHMDEALLIVVRYFGGVLLGAGRLMSTYLETGVQTIQNADLLQIENRYVYSCKMSYKDFEDFKQFARKNDYEIENISYGEDVTLDILLKDDNSEDLSNYFPHISIEVNGLRKIYIR